MVQQANFLIFYRVLIFPASCCMLIMNCSKIIFYRKLIFLCWHTYVVRQHWSILFKEEFFFFLFCFLFSMAIGAKWKIMENEKSQVNEKIINKLSNKQTKIKYQTNKLAKNNIINNYGLYIQGCGTNKNINIYYCYIYCYMLIVNSIVYRMLVKFPVASQTLLYANLILQQVLFYRVLIFP